MSTHKIINPTPRKKKNATSQIELDFYNKRNKTYKHRPVFYSDRPDKLGTRPLKYKLNPKQKRNEDKKLTKKRKRRNPKTVVYANKRRSVARVKSYRRRRNPEGIFAMKATNILTMGGAAAVGGVAAPWIGSTFGIDGNMKYISGAGVALIGWYILKRLLPEAAVPFAAGAIGVTMYQLAIDKQLLAGLSGDDDNTALQQWTPEDLNNLEEIKAAVIEAKQNAQLSGIPVNNSLGAIKVDDIAGNEFDEFYN